jgi:glycosyltransferase involved in cell wall biosynthesis
VKVALLGDAESIHFLRWANGLAERGRDVVAISLHQPLQGYDPRVKMVRIGPAAPAGYVLAAGTLRRELQVHNPDLLHAHYASGYGTLGALSGCRRLVLSVWGSDVYEFPLRSTVHRELLKRNLAAAIRITSTSYAMKVQTRAFTDRPIDVVPFGVDTRLFRPARDRKNESEITIGTVKTMAPKYGIDTLIRAAALLASDATFPRFSVRIVGGGPDMRKLQQLADSLGLSSRTTFAGPVDYASVPDEFNRFTVAAFPSREESFGCAVIEAMACGVPVVASAVYGFREVLSGGEFGVLVPHDDPQALAAALRALVLDADRRRALSEKGRKAVTAHYEWADSVDRMLGVYDLLTRDQPPTHSQSSGAGC